MKKRLFPLLLAGLLLLSGCQLANPDWGASKAEAQLAGIYVTTNLEEDWDAPAYFSQNADGTYYLDNVTGWLLSAADAADPIFSGLSVDVHTDDSGTDCRYDGTLYVMAQENMPYFHFNPVYRDVDGQLYALHGNGVSFSEESVVGMSSAYSADTKTATTEHGKTVEDITRFTAHLTVTAKPISYTILSLDDQYQVLSSEQYAPDQLPEELLPAEGAAYLLVESHGLNHQNQETVIRAIYTHDHAEVSFFVPDGSVVCAKVTRPIQW